MKSVIINTYLMGLCSFLDEKGYRWETVKTTSNDDSNRVKVYYKDANKLFRIGYEFGEFSATLQD